MKALLRGTWREDEEGVEDTNFLACKCLFEGFIIPGGNGAAFVTSVNYFAEGRTIDRVEIVKLVLNIHDQTLDAGRKKCGDASKALLRAVQNKPPPALLAALHQSKAGVFRIEGGRIRYEVWSIPIERQRLTIETGAVVRR